MKKKWTFLSLVFVIGLFYFVRYHKNREIYALPKEADVVITFDKKNIVAYYFTEWLKNPSGWLQSEPSKSNINFRKSGVKIPDFPQLFHLKNEAFNQWYFVLEIENKSKLLKLLAQQNFKKEQPNLFTKAKISLMIADDFLIVALGKSGTNQNLTKLSNNLKTKNLKWATAQDFIQNSHASINFYNNKKLKQFEINLTKDTIEIGDFSENKNFENTIKKQSTEPYFLQLQLGQEALKNLAVLDQDFKTEELQLNSIKAFVELHKVKDSIITYSYDENFNEVENISFQEIVQPAYTLSIASKNPKKTMSYFYQHHWINAKNEFTKIPFLPNSIHQKKSEIVISSTRKLSKYEDNKLNNFIFINNSTDFVNLFSTWSPTEKSLLNDIDYVFINAEKSGSAKIGIRKKEKPLILRFSDYY